MTTKRARHGTTARVGDGGPSRTCRRIALGGMVLGLGTFGGGCGGVTTPQPPCPPCAKGELPLTVKTTVEPVASPSAPTGGTTLAEAQQFMADAERELKRLSVRRERSGWVQLNFITVDTEALAADASRDVMEYLSRTIRAATRFDRLEMPAELRRKFLLLKLAGTLPAPADPAAAAELATIMSRMESTYGKGKVCSKAASPLRRELEKLAPDAAAKTRLECKGDEGGAALGELSALMAKSRDEQALREAWLGWHRIAPPMRKDYARSVELANAGAREIGFADVGEMWRAGYDMPPDAFRKEADRLWGQLKPFYDELHCFVRSRLRKQYGAGVVPVKGLIPAHLLGNMWAQSWENLYPLVEPYPGAASLDVTKRLEQKKYDARKLVKAAEGFYTSLDLAPLPATFWQRSLFVKPADRDVECHASAWDVSYSDDLRIKMCIKINEQDFATVHHELGHNYYQHYYLGQPFLFQGAANDGFHEAIGDTIALSITPSYLQRIGLFDRVQPNAKATTNYLMKMALTKVAFLPFGRMMDEWRYDVFSGRIAPDAYDKGWWELRRRYQGIAPPVPRSEEDFDPGAKYHIPASVPYMRYFLAFVYQFQLQRALCRVSGHKGPLHECSIYGNKEAGKKLRALLEMGQSKPWPEALAALTGEHEADAGALLEYFEPLRAWLREQNNGETCGW